MKIFHFSFSPEARQKIRHLPPSVKKEVRACLEELKENPWEGKILQRELTGLLSLRVKNYRILYQIDDDKKEIAVLTLGIRKTIYEEAAKKWEKRI